MPKTSLGKPKVGECRITRKSGITYVYERTTQYSRKLYKTVTLSTRLLGKIRRKLWPRVPEARRDAVSRGREPAACMWG